MTRTKTFVNNLLMSKFLWRSSLEQKLHIFEIVISNTKWKDYKCPKNLCVKNFTCTDKLYVHEIAVVNFSKIYFLKNAKKRCKPNSCDINRYWIILSLNVSQKLVVSEVLKLVKLILTVLATNAVSKSSCPTLRWFKSYMRSSITQEQEHLNSCYL